MTGKPSRFRVVDSRSPKPLSRSAKVALALSAGYFVSALCLIDLSDPEAAVNLVMSLPAWTVVLFFLTWGVGWSLAEILVTLRQRRTTPHWPRRLAVAILVLLGCVYLPTSIVVHHIRRAAASSERSLPPNEKAGDPPSRGDVAASAESAAGTRQ